MNNLISTTNLIKTTLKWSIITWRNWIIYLVFALIINIIFLIPVFKAAEYLITALEIALLIPLIVANVIIGLRKGQILISPDIDLKQQRSRFSWLCLWSIIQNLVVWGIAYIPYFAFSFMSGWKSMIGEIPLPTEPGDIISTLLFTKDFAILQYLTIVLITIIVIIPGLWLLFRIAFIDLVVFQEGRRNPLPRTFQLTAHPYFKIAGRIFIIYTIGFGIPMLCRYIPIGNEIIMNIFNRTINYIFMVWNTVGIGILYANLITPSD